MAWIKAENHTPKKGEILRIAATLQISRREAYATCMEFWMWADAETADGRLAGYSVELLDQVMEQKGFGEAMCKVNWLLKDGDDLVIPNWEHHNGRNTKKRLLATRREQKHRIRKGQGK